MADNQNNQTTGQSGNAASGASANGAAGATATLAPVIDLRKTAPTGASPAAAQPSALDTALASAQMGITPPEKYNIPQAVKDKYPELVQLIIVTESMNDEERNYWFQILPIMTDDQVEKLKGILVKEKQQLTKLDQEYNTELNQLNQKHLLEWKEFEAREKRKALKDAENKNEEQEKDLEEDLLKRLTDA